MPPARGTIEWLREADISFEIRHRKENEWLLDRGYMIINGQDIDAMGELIDSSSGKKYKSWFHAWYNVKGAAAWTKDADRVIYDVYNRCAEIFDRHMSRRYGPQPPIRLDFHDQKDAVSFCNEPEVKGVDLIIGSPPVTYRPTSTDYFRHREGTLKWMREQQIAYHIVQNDQGLWEGWIVVGPYKNRCDYQCTRNAWGEVGLYNGGYFLRTDRNKKPESAQEKISYPWHVVKNLFRDKSQVAEKNPYDRIEELSQELNGCIREMDLLLGYEPTESDVSPDLFFLGKEREDDPDDDPPVYKAAFPIEWDDDAWEVLFDFVCHRASRAFRWVCSGYHEKFPGIYVKWNLGRVA